MRFKFPNYLTIGRIIIVPIFVFTFYLPGFYGDILPFALFVIASFTDFLDGLLARMYKDCLLYTSPSPRDRQKSRMPSSA